jgi:hypothetical protein
LKEIGDRAAAEKERQVIRWALQVTREQECGGAIPSGRL